MAQQSSKHQYYAPLNKGIVELASGRQLTPGGIFPFTDKEVEENKELFATDVLLEVNEVKEVK